MSDPIESGKVTANRGVIDMTPTDISTVVTAVALALGLVIMMLILTNVSHLGR